MEEAVYIINELSDYFKVPYQGVNYVFYPSKPLKIDYAEDPRKVSFILQFVELRLATKKEIEEAAEVAAAKEKIEIAEVDGVKEETAVDKVVDTKAKAKRKWSK